MKTAIVLTVVAGARGSHGPTVSASYGVAFQMRIHTELSNRPATFVIDKSGKLRFARRAKTFSDRPTPEKIVEELKALTP